MFQNEALLEISKNLQAAMLLETNSWSIFFFWKLLENLQEELCHGIFFDDMEAYILQHSALPVFEIPENSWDNVC